MKNKLIYIIIIVSLLSIQALFAKKPDIYHEADLSRLTTEPDFKYNYKTKISKEERDKAILELGEKLNKYTHTKIKLNNIDKKKSDNLTFKVDEIKNDAVLNIFSPDTMGFLYAKGLSKIIDEKNKPNLPHKFEVKDIAVKHLKNLDELPEDDFVYQTGTAFRAIYNPETGEEYSFGLKKMILMKRKLNGITVEGPSSKIFIDLGDNGELMSLMKNWPKIEKQMIDKKNNMINIKDRKSHIENKLQSKYMNKNIDSITIKKSKVIYYDDGKGLIEPAIFVEGEIKNNKGNKKNEMWIIPLLKNPKAKYTINNISSELPDDNRIEMNIEEYEYNEKNFDSDDLNEIE
jgi:hypothetical protein